LYLSIAGEITARIQGDKIAEAAFKQSLAGDKPGYQDAKARLQNTINTPGEAAKIDPNFKIDEMGWMTQRMSGLTKDGLVKGGMFESAGGLLDNKPKEKNLKGFIQSLTEYNPEARARMGQDMLVGNIGKIMASYFSGTDVEGFGKWWRGFQQGDMTQAADLSAAVMNAPEFYTVLPAAKGFDIDSRLATWQQTDSARQMVRNMADTLGENPMTFIENMAKQGTAEQDFIRLTERLKALDTPEAKAMLKDIADGHLTVDILADSVKMFSKGDEVEASVLNIDMTDGDKPKISLGIKQLIPDPWDRIPYEYPVGKVVAAKVQKVLDFGAFVELEKGVEGLVHVSEISEERVEDPRNVLKAGQDVQVEVISLDPQERKIGLSIKAAQRKAEVSAAQGYAGGSDMGAKLGDLFAQAKDKKAKKKGRKARDEGEEDYDE